MRQIMTHPCYSCTGVCMRTRIMQRRQGATCIMQRRQGTKKNPDTWGIGAGAIRGWVSVCLHRY